MIAKWIKVKKESDLQGGTILTESDSFEYKLTELYREMAKLDPVSDNIYRENMNTLIKVICEIHEFLESDVVKKMFREIDGIDTTLSQLWQSRDDEKIPIDGRLHSMFLTSRIKQLLMEFEGQLKISTHLKNTFIIKTEN